MRVLTEIATFLLGMAGFFTVAYSTGDQSVYFLILGMSLLGLSTYLGVQLRRE